MTARSGIAMRYGVRPGFFQCPGCGLMRDIEVRAADGYCLCCPYRLAAPTNPYGCHNRVATAAPDCQYTLSALGQKDARCTGCQWRVEKSDS